MFNLSLRSLYKHFKPSDQTLNPLWLSNYYIYGVSQKTPTTLSMLRKTTSLLFFKTEPLSGTARFGRCRASKCPFHTSSINRTCAAHRAVYITNGVQTMYHLRHWRAYIGGAELDTHNPVSAVLL